MLQPIASRPLRVLIVDDLPDLIQSMALLLRLWGHDVRTARNGSEALDVAAEYRPDVVLLDVGLPGMDGYQVARRLRSNPNCRRTFLVSITGYGGEAHLERSREAGCDHHLLKPINPSDLERLLASCKEAANPEDAHDTSERTFPHADTSAPSVPAAIQGTAEDRLRRHHYLTLRRVSCEYHAGTLTLRGCLPTYYLKQLAQATVADIEGVERIDNEIEVGNAISARPL